MNAHTKHTPGPWIIRPDGAIAAKADVSQWLSDYVCQMPFGSVSESEEVPRWMADAELICAAPDLLEALKELIEGVAILTPDAPAPVPGSIISNAIAAVAKAEGKRHD